ncbi:kinase-like domain-containing protein [Achaetomium macrosporum]|uniref:Kinase-like domain-containing protein n=1 Tax=Achaetomium macrosporum TaxID=79813 RepID=A0AAN7C8G5_9PEZI|nr:kinase-like domain-containing protein [Achaetomium macrosporum]
MSAPSPGPPAQPRRSALKGEGDSPRTPPLSVPVKAVQIAEPEPSTPDDPQVKKQFSAGVAKRLSGRPPLSNGPSRSSTLSQVSMDSTPDLTAAGSTVTSAEEAQNQQPHAHRRHRLDHVIERLLAQVADWLEREKVKKQRKKSRKYSSCQKSPASHLTTPVAPPTRLRADSIESDSSDVSLDQLQRILDDNMAALGLNSITSSSLPSFSPRLRQKPRKKSSKNLSRTMASSDTEWFDGDIVVPSCEAFLDNSKTLSYTGGKAAAGDSASISGRREEKEKQNWLTFKNEIIRLAHTLRLKGWRQVPLDSGESISVERLSGALTNAVYVVSPPPESLLTREPGKKQPTKVLLRIYGPQVEHLIDRENELGVLRRLARKTIGPRLLGTFLNGRFEQYLNATALTPSSMREPETSKQIAKRMRELHDGVELLEEEKDQGPGVWRNWDKWLSQVEKTVLFLDKQILSNSTNLPGGVWKTRGFVCGVQWPVFKSLVEKYRRHLEAYYGDTKKIRDKLVFAHNDTQYGNILRVRPDDQKSPLLQPANEHKQLVVIDFEYAGANVPGLEFANHFSEWTYNYHDPARPYACDTSRYPTPDQQRRFLKAYVDHRPQFPYVGSSSPCISASPAAVNPQRDGLHTTPSTTSIVEFMLDARVPPGGWKEEEQKREEEAERRVRELMEETRLWRTANSAQWVAWGIVQAKIDVVDTSTGGYGETNGADGAAEAVNGTAEGEIEAPEEEFDYLGYAQERAYFFLGDCVLLGLVTPDELGEEVRGRLKMVDY